MLLGQAKHLFLRQHMHLDFIGSGAAQVIRGNKFVTGTVGWNLKERQAAGFQMREHFGEEESNDRRGIVLKNQNTENGIARRDRA